MDISNSDIQIFERTNDIIRQEGDWIYKGKRDLHGTVNYIDDSFVKIAVDIHKNELILTDDIKSINYNDHILPQYFMMIASIHSNNLEILTYFSRLLQNLMSNHWYDENEYKYIYYACAYNPNLCVTRYFIEERLAKKMEFWDMCNGLSLMDLAAMKNENVEIGSYIYNLLDFESMVCEARHESMVSSLMDIEKLKKFIFHLYSNSPDIRKFNKFLLPYINHKHFNEINTYVKTLNPLFLNKYNHRAIDFYPSDLGYKEFIDYVDQAKKQIPMDIWLNYESYSQYDKYEHYDEYCGYMLDDMSSNYSVYDRMCSNYSVYDKSVKDITKIAETDINENKDYYIDSSLLPLPLFKHNNQIYFGDRKKVYESMMIFEDLVNEMDFTELPILDGVQPKYILNMYVYAALTGIFKINSIESCDIMGFIKLIDQYPLKKLPLKSLETDIIKYFEKNDVEYDEYMQDICTKYQLRIMYIAIYNQNIEKLNEKYIDTS